MAKAFEELIGIHLDGLYTAALCFTLDEHRAEELLQEAAIRAFHEFPQRQPGGDFRRLMLNFLVSTYLQRQRREGRDPLAPDAALNAELVSDVPEPDMRPFPEPGTSGYRLLLDWIGGFWPQLDDGDRLILWLADVERIRHRRIAEMVGLSMEQVLKRHYRARGALSRGATRELNRRASGGIEA